MGASGAVALARSRADRLQQRFRPTAFAFAVVKKFGDDGGGSLAAQLTYYGFLSLFPLLLLLLTVLGLVSGGDPSSVHRVESSALSQFPIVGQNLGSNIHELHNRATVGLIVGIAGLVWGSQGAMQSAQHAMAEVWNIPAVERPGYGARLLRTLGTLGVLALFLGASTGLAGITTVGARPRLEVLAGIALTLLLNGGLYALVFRLLTPGQVRWPSLLPGAALGGLGWTVLQLAGGTLVNHTLRNTSQVYGVFAVVLGLLAWIYLAAELTLYAAEVNVVRERRLWPRSLGEPARTEADERVLTDVTLETRSVPGQQVAVRFDSDASPAAAPAASVPSPAPAPVASEPASTLRGMEPRTGARDDSY